jgi:putative ABC transport system permease protein
MLVGFIAVIPVLLGPVVRALARLVTPSMPVEGAFAAEQLLRRPTRTALTVGVLVVAVSTSLGMGNAILTNVDDVRQWYRRTMSGDIFLMGAGAAAADIETRNRADCRQLIAGQSGVAGVVEVRYLAARVNGVPAGCIVRDFLPRAELPWALSADVEAGIRQRLKAGDAVVGSALAKRAGLRVGDTARFELQGRVLSLRVAGLVRDYMLGGLSVFLERTAASQHIELGPPDLYIVQTAPNVQREPLVRSLEPLAKQEGLVVQSFAALRDQVDALIDGIVGALWGLLAVGFIVGGVAVGNTLTMSVLEQTRELGLLRIIGMTKRQARKLVFCESLLLGILGAVLGTIVGLTTAWIIHLCNEPLVGHWVPFSLHGWLLAANAGICLAITLVAAWLPGRRAAALDLLAAVAYE